jgi:hypothetical protein
VLPLVVAPQLTIILRYSFFPDEAEILLSPNARFIVSSEVNLEVCPMLHVVSFGPAAFARKLIAVCRQMAITTWT